jgi:hypothetical protein
MASSFSTNYGFEKITTGEQSGTWGTTTNYNFDILDRITAYAAVALSDASTATLTVRAASPTDGADNTQAGMFRVIKFTGTLSQNCTITIAPATTTAYFMIQNATSGGYSTIMAQGSAAATVSVLNGKTNIVYCDASDEVISITNSLAFGNLGLSANTLASLDTNGDINLAPNGTGDVVFDTDLVKVGGGSEEGVVTSNGAYDLTLETNSGTNSSKITITDAANGDVSVIPNGTGELVLGSGSASGKITSSGAFDLELDTNSGTNSGSIVITDAANGDITIATNGTGAILCSDDILQRPILKDYGEVHNALGDTGGGSDTIDLASGNVVSATVSTGTQTFVFSNPTASANSCSFTLLLTNGQSQGAITWPGSVDWAGGTAPTLTASGLDILVFTTIDGGTIWHGAVASTDSKSP